MFFLYSYLLVKLLYYNFYAAVLGAAFFGVVCCDRGFATHAFGCEAVGCNAFADEGIHECVGTTM